MKPSPDHPWYRMNGGVSRSKAITPDELRSRHKVLRDGRRVRTISDEMRDAEIAKALRENKLTRHEAVYGDGGLSDPTRSSIGNGGYQKRVHRYG